MLTVQNLSKKFSEKSPLVLSEVSFRTQKGTLVSITGRSGSGKSTLLYCISTLDRPTSGEVLYDQTLLRSMSEEQIHHFRNRRMGFVFQFHFLLPELTAIENVLMPTIKNQEQEKLKSRAGELLDSFGLTGKHHRLPKELSGGEMQRVAIARSLIYSPEYLFADEPTGNLDSANAERVMQIFREVTTTGTTVIFVTHDPDFAAVADHKLHLVDGKLVEDRGGPAATDPNVKNPPD